LVSFCGLLFICCKKISCNLFVYHLWTCHIVKDALFVFFKLSFAGFWLFSLLQMWMSWRATLPQARLHYIKFKNVWQWLFFKSKGFSWLPWKLTIKWRIKTITTMKKSRHYKKMQVQVEQEDVRINRVYWQKIDTQKGVVDYLQSLLESGKSTYEVVNKVSKGVVPISTVWNIRLLFQRDIMML